jgi:SecD/SecF fusion protein
MLNSLSKRLGVVLALVAIACFALWNNYQKTTTPDRRGQPVSLGLDLQGGVHLDLELDQSQRVSSDPERDVEVALTVLRKRIDEFGVMEPLIQKVGKDRIIVELPGLTDPERAKEIVRRTAFLEFRITDESGALEKALPAMDRVLHRMGIGTDAREHRAVERLLGTGSTADSLVQTAGALSALIMPGSSLGLALMPGEFAVPEQSWERVDSLLKHPEVARLLPRNVALRWLANPMVAGRDSFRLLYVLEDKVMLTGQHLVDAQAEVDPVTQGSIVTFELNHQGGKAFGRQTAAHIQDYMAIVLDDRVQGRPPVIQSEINRNGQITLGNRTIREAQDLALTLRAGALPIPLTLVNEGQVVPVAGEDSIRGGIIAGIVGTGLVVFIVTGYYALSGVLAVIALALYVLITFGGLALVGATLTLPGFAGFVLSIGFAVDANVLIFERIREEVAKGMGVRRSVDEGFRHALPAIIDSNLTTVLTALFLYQFGTGPVKGFAVTLIIGIFASMLTAVFVTHTLYMVWLRWRPEMKELSLGRLRLFQSTSYDFIRLRRAAYALTVLILLVGAAFLAVRGVNYSVEFTGGTLAEVQTADPVDPGELRVLLAKRGLPGTEIQRFGGSNGLLIRSGSVDPEVAGSPEVTAKTVIGSALTEMDGANSFEIRRFAEVGPKVGGELRVQALKAILLSFLAVLAYLAYRFEWRFGLAAVAATAHDILMTIAFIAALKLEVSLVIVAALLTVVGYSLNDTIVIFDRVREHLRKPRREGFTSILNAAINETLPRTILTGGTALATLVALAVFGGEVIRPFALVMFFGIFTGTFSSIFIASPILYWIEQRRPRAVPGRRDPAMEVTSS